MPDQTAEKIIERLASGKPVPAIVLLGTDVYLRDMCRNKIIEACVPEGARDWAVARVRRDCRAGTRVLQRAQTLPMLAPRQVIIVEEAESVEKLGEKARDEILEGLAKYLESPAPFTVLVARSGGARRAAEVFQIAEREGADGGADHWRRNRPRRSPRRWPMIWASKSTAMLRHCSRTF